MTIASATRSGKTVILLGLSKEEIDQLRAGEPLEANKDSHGDAIPEGMTIGLIQTKSPVRLNAMMTILIPERPLRVVIA